MKVELEERLPRWVEEELLAPSQAQAILAAERRRRATPAAGGPRITLLAEALGYVGATLAVVAVGLIVGEYWDQMEAWGRVVLSGLVTLVAAGAAHTLRGSDEPAVRRLVSLLWLATVVGVATTSGVALHELTDLDEERAVLVMSGLSTATALAAYLPRRTALQQLALLGSGLALIGSGITVPDGDLAPLFVGLVFVGAGLGWTALAWGGLLPPRTLGLVSGLIVAGIGAQVMAFDDRSTVGILVGIGVAALLVVLSVLDRRTLFLGFGAVGLFVFVPQLVFHWFGDSLGAPLALLLTGLLLIVGAVGAARLKSEVIDDAEVAT